MQTWVVWCLTDRKPGHYQQLLGLCQRLAAHQPLELHWLDINQPLQLPLKRPKLIIGAGSGSHWPLWRLARRYRCANLVLMKPWLPLACFDHAIIPKHDGHFRSDKVLSTAGVLNNVVPATQTCEQALGIMLLGGPSKHYQWSQEQVLAQIKKQALQRPEIHWQVANSRRSPEDLLPQIQAMGLSNLSLHDHRQTHGQFVAEHLSNSQYALITPDSVSMLYEALTAGCRVGIFELPALGQGRVVRGVQQLVAEGQISPLAEVWQQPRGQLWEAERAALWLINRIHS